MHICCADAQHPEQSCVCHISYTVLLRALLAFGNAQCIDVASQAHMAMGHHLLIDMTPEQLEADHVRYGV